MTDQTSIQKLKPIYAFTDGAAKGNSQKSNSGWGIFIPEFNYKNYGYLVGSNNIAELYAILRLLETLKTFKQLKLIQDGQVVVINTDSEYSIGVLDKGHTPKANKKIIEHIKKLRLKLMIEYKIKTVFNHVVAHQKDDSFLSKCNNIVDILASESAKQQGMLFEAL